MGLGLIALATAATPPAPSVKDLDSMSADEIRALRAKLKSGDRKGLKPYSDRIEQTDTLPTPRASRQLKSSIPMRTLPISGREIIDMVRVTPEQIEESPTMARRFWHELQTTKKSYSYRTKESIKALTDKWISWLEAKGFNAIPTAATHEDFDRPVSRSVSPAAARAAARAEAFGLDAAREEPGLPRQTSKDRQ